MLQPKLFTTLKTYSLQSFFSDLMAGIIVGIVAIPLAIAFAIASGVSPDKGLITAIVAGFIISAFGGSRVQIGGPTGAFVVLVYSIVQRYGIDGLTVATVLAGVLLIILGAAKLGTSIQFVPHPVIVGFTSGIAVIIFSSQMKDFLGLPVDHLPAEFTEKWAVIAEHLPALNPHALLAALGTVLIVAFWPRVSRRVPGSLLALILFTWLAHRFHWPVETIGSRFGELPASLPAPRLPAVSLGMIRDLIQPAFAIALLGGIESLLSAIVSDGMIGGKHRSNMELIAQGGANIFSALFGGIPATGAIARTVTNIKNGGRTPIAGIVHAVTVLVIVLFFGRWVKLIPLACLAGVLVIVAYNMSEWRSFVAVTRGLKSDAIVLVITFAITVLLDLTVAIEIGMVLAMFMFMHRMAEVTHVHIFEEEVEEESPEHNVMNKIKVPKGVEVYEINGPFFFGVSHKFEEAVRAVAKMPKIRILRLRHVPIIDGTGVHSLKQFYKKCRHAHIPLILSGLRSQPLNALKKSELYDMIGKENIVGNLRVALKRAEDILAGRETPPDESTMEAETHEQS